MAWLAFADTVFTPGAGALYCYLLYAALGVWLHCC